MTDSLAREIRVLEERLLQPATRSSAHELDSLLADDFVEFGSSGRVFDKRSILAALLEEDGTFRVSMQNFNVSILAPGVVLATYRLVDLTVAESPKQALRSSVWVHRANAWQVVFHQGTRTDEAPL